MCETNVFLRVGENDELLFESLARIEIDGDMLKLTSIFGEKKTVKGRIREINFQGGRLLIEELV